MMEEGQGAPGAYRNGMISKVRGYRYQLDKLKKDIVSLITVIWGIGSATVVECKFIAVSHVYLKI